MESRHEGSPEQVGIGARKGSLIRSDEMSHKLIQDFGFGIIPKHIMKNTDVSLQAKGIYAYLCSYAGNKDTAFPSVKLITYELGVSKDTFYKYLSELQLKGYVEIEKERDKGKFCHNVYRLLPCPKSSDTVLSDTVLPDTVFSDTNINSSNINSINKNNTKTGGSSSELGELAKLYQQAIGQPNGMTATWLSEILEEHGFEWCKESFIAADKSGVRTKAYVEGILNKWKTSGGMKKSGERKKVEAPKRANKSTWSNVGGLMNNLEV